MRPYLPSQISPQVPVITEQCESRDPCLPGFEDIICDSEPSPDINDFLALRLDPPTAHLVGERLPQFCGRCYSHDRLVRPENLHVSLHGFGPCLTGSRFMHASVLAAAASIASAPFVVTFDHATSFDVKRFKKPFVLRGYDGVTALGAFHQQLGTALKRRGLQRFVRSNFTPHLTLLYSPKIRAELPVEQVSWTVREFALLRSIVGQSRQVELARWPLRG
ncbi:MAG: 2'-5' RNA ligase family protein [Verrucomicrobia bacterium]|nr:2'-5' RNA ligase family protein [Verrucomicrobiota bacterium]